MSGHLNREQFPLSDARFLDKRRSGKAHCEPGWNWCPQPLPDFDIWYAVSGKGRMKLGGTEYTIGKGCCFLVRPGDRPESVQDPNDRLTVIFAHFDVADSRTGEAWNPELMPGRFAQVKEPFLFESLLNRMLQVVDSEDAWREQEFDLLLKHAMLHMYQSQQPPSSSSSGKQKQLIARLVSKIRQDPGRRISHRELAEEAQLSPEYLNVLFKTCTGRSIRTFITEARLERAAMLLAETAMNVSQVAEALNYANVYLFSKQFKAKYGLPPSAYKQNVPPSLPHKG
ncbi:AraC family transcriptional regulator [Paenibacillus sp. N4]|uniref:AraC family transcriptional regulator n=1 Tax=Paenibacillus vietnamensis TaxID=2590547 RepID=UPI001CD06D09|nr:AraC family transcriptional regulator [Paenibacillus vietnamensis]MCA0756707.1 AraC family transcriptional regulator [Paenibacillus vietnamensis]